MNLILAGNIPDKILNKIKNEGFKVYKTPLNSNLLEGLGYHPDMQIAKIDDVYVSDIEVYNYYQTIFNDTPQKIMCGKTKCNSNYPGDIAYNIKVINNKVFHNFKYTDKVVLDAVSGKTMINVPQGYSGCSICKAGENAIITSDSVIYDCALKNGIDALKILPGHIKLSGFDYGFIGGASFSFEDKIYFFGDITAHPDYIKIADFCRKNNTQICLLSDDVLSDYGSAVTID